MKAVSAAIACDAEHAQDTGLRPADIQSDEPEGFVSGQERCATAAALTRRQGYWFQQASVSPVFISHHHRVSHVLTSIEWYHAHLTPASCLTEDPAVIIRQATDLFGEGFFWLDKDMRIVGANQAAATHFGVEREQFVGQLLLNVSPALGDSLIFGKLRSSLRDGTRHSADVPSVVRQGGWVHFETFPFREGVACWFRVITDEMEAHRLADVKGAILAAMDAHGGVGYARLNNRLSIDRTDNAFAQMIRISRDRLIGVTFLDLVERKYRVDVRDWLETVLRSDGCGGMDCALLSNDGTVLPVRMGLAELRGQYVSEGAVVVVTRR